MNKFIIAACALTCVLTFSNCASIIHGPMQSVDINSQPAGAKITINGQSHGVTPKTIYLRRKGYMKGEPKGTKEYITKIELDGFYPYELKLKRQMDGWFLGNLLIGGIIGIVIDAANGSMYKLSPDQVIAQMSKEPGSTTRTNENGDIMLSVVLHADPSWEKIGALTKR